MYHVCQSVVTGHEVTATSFISVFIFSATLTSLKNSITVKQESFSQTVDEISPLTMGMFHYPAPPQPQQKEVTNVPHLNLYANPLKHRT